MLAETCFGLAKYAGGQARVLELLRRGAVRPDFDLHGEIAFKYAMGRLELKRVAPEELPRPELNQHYVTNAVVFRGRFDLDGATPQYLGDFRRGAVATPNPDNLGRGSK